METADSQFRILNSELGFQLLSDEPSVSFGTYKECAVALHVIATFPEDNPQAVIHAEPKAGLLVQLRLSEPTGSNEMSIAGWSDDIGRHLESGAMSLSFTENFAWFSIGEAALWAPGNLQSTLNHLLDVLISNGISVLAERCHRCKLRPPARTWAEANRVGALCEECISDQLHRVGLIEMSETANRADRLQIRMLALLGGLLGAVGWSAISIGLMMWAAVASTDSFPNRAGTLGFLVIILVWAAFSAGPCTLLLRSIKRRRKTGVQKLALWVVLAGIYASEWIVALWWHNRVGRASPRFSSFAALPDYWASISRDGWFRRIVSTILSLAIAYHGTAIQRPKIEV